MAAAPSQDEQMEALQPARWLSRPLEQAQPGGDAADGPQQAGGSVNGDAAEAATNGGIETRSVFVAFHPSERVRLDAGAAFEFTGLDTDAPRLRLADGAEFVGAWEENVGTSVVFAEPAGEERAARYAGHAEWTLVMRRRTS